MAAEPCVAALTAAAASTTTTVPSPAPRPDKRDRQVASPSASGQDEPDAGLVPRSARYDDVRQASAGTRSTVDAAIPAASAKASAKERGDRDRSASARRRRRSRGEADAYRASKPSAAAAAVARKKSASQSAFCWGRIRRQHSEAGETTTATTRS